MARFMVLGASLVVMSCTITRDPPGPRADCYLASGPIPSALPSLAAVPPRQSATPATGTILRVVATTTLPGATSSTDIVADAARERVYVLSSDGLLVTVDTKTNAVLASLDVGELTDGMAVDAATGRLYVHVTRSTSSSGVGALAVIEGNKVVVTVEPSAAASFAPGVLAVNPRTGCVYIGDFSGKVAIVDVRTNAVQGSLDVGGQPIGIAVDAEANRVFVATAGPTSGLTIIDGSSNTVLKSLIGLDTPRAIAVSSSANGRVYLSTDPETLTILDGATGAIRKTVAVMNRPDAVAVDPNAGRIYVANVGAGTVSVIDATTDEVLGTAVVAQAMGEGIAVDTRTGRVYTEEHYAQPRTLKAFER